MQSKRLLCVIPFVIVLSAIYFNCQAQQRTDSVRLDVFDLIRPNFEVMEFIAESDFITDRKDAAIRLVDDLKKEKIYLERETDNNPSSGEGVRMKTKDGSISITILEHTDGDYLYDKWRSSLKNMGTKSDIRNDEGGSVFFKVKTKTNGAVGSLFYTGRNFFEIVVSLPFPVEMFNDLNFEKQSIVKEKYETVYKILETIARVYVVPAEFVFYPTKGQLSREQRLYGLIQFWTEVKYNFAFFDHVPDLNWDHVLTTYLPIMEKDQSTEEYYRNLSKMCALLKDGHTNIYPPNSITAAIASPPVKLVNIQNRAIVSNTSQGLIDKLPIGSEVTRIDNVLTQQFLREQMFPFISTSTEHNLFDNAIRSMLNGKEGTQVKLEFKTPKGETRELVLDRNDSDVVWVRTASPFKRFAFKQLPGKVAYVALNTFGNSAVVVDFENKIDSINSCSKLIIDLRSNGGGNSGNGYRIIEHLTSSPFLTSKWRTREHRSAYKAWGKFRMDNHRTAAQKKKEEPGDWDKTAIEYYKGDHWYSEPSDTIIPPRNKKINLPIVVLIGHNTASAAEDFLIALESTKRATTIGSKTFGSTGQPLDLKLPGGGSARVCTKRDEYPDGREFVGFGIKPDLEIESDVVDLIEENDSVLEKALQVLKALEK
jgi:carboxyl-terminal processing protease